MRNFILIASLLAVNCKKPSTIISSPSLPPTIPSHPVIIPSHPAIKNIQLVSDDAAYESFGVLDYSRQNIYTYYYRRGTSHLHGGNPVYREYNALTKKWGGPVTITTDTKDGSVFGGRMDNDSTVLFLGRSNNGLNGDWSIDIQIIKCDSNNKFSLPRNFNWAGIPKLQRQLFYGHIVKGEMPGEYFMPMYQLRIGSSNSRRLLQCFYTTDYWNTYNLRGTIYDGTIPFSETSMVYLGNGRLMTLTRNDVTGILVPFESVDNGVTWKRRSPSNLYWWILRSPEIPFVYNDTATGTFDIIYECRDANMIEISKYNDLNNFGILSPFYRNPEIYAHNFGAGENPSLGYPSMIRMKDGNFLIIYSKQFNDYKANLLYTEDDLSGDPAGIPEKPVIVPSYITQDSFRVDITGYDDKQVENIRWLSEDMSEDSSFDTFTTCRYRTNSYPAVEMHDVRMTGFWNTYSWLKPQTTYWLRIKACNNKGCSDYSFVKVVTHG
ncbi:MAG: sialidase family protein [Chitinophagales bacterium]